MDWLAEAQQVYIAYLGSSLKLFRLFNAKLRHSLVKLNYVFYQKCMKTRNSYFASIFGKYLYMKRKVLIYSIHQIINGLSSKKADTRDKEKLPVDTIAGTGELL